jgi:hypothetical protein
MRSRTAVAAIVSASTLALAPAPATPQAPDRLERALAPIFDIEGALKWLALEATAHR